MKSPLPKVLHPIAGEPMIRRAVLAAKQAGAHEIRVVVGNGASLVRKVVEPLGAFCFEQAEQRGTAHAVLSAEPKSLKGIVVILNGDHPLIESTDIQKMVGAYNQGANSLVVVSAVLKQPGSFGRIVRNQGQLYSIVEAKDGGPDTKNIREINTGIYLARAEVFAEFLPQIKNQNVQKEFYLTDIVALVREAKKGVEAIQFPAHVAFGVNTQEELMRAGRIVFRRNASRLMENGVIIVDAATTYIESDVEVGEGSVIYPGSFLKSGTRIGKFCVIEPHSFVNASTLGEAVQIRQGSYLERVKVAARCEIGPYARLRPETEIGEGAKVGNFVEMKKVKFGAGAKASHLTYLGDAVIGEDTNIGCGTITCNYAVDKQKYVTRIGKNVFVGSDSQFVAPVEVGDNAVIGSGSTITKNVPSGALAVSRGRQTNIENYKPKK